MLQSPLADMATIADLLELPYFDLLACLGFYSIHPGGIHKTRNLIASMSLSPDQKVLEIGSGSGFTSTALIKAGADLTIVDPTERLLSAALRNCKLFAGKIPKYFCCKAEEIKSDNKYDAVLMEAVYGFVDDKDTLHAKLKDLLNPHGKIGVIDFFYHTEPPSSIIENMKQVFGDSFITLTKENWKDNFDDFELISWLEFEAAETKNFTPLLLHQSLEHVYLSTHPIFQESRNLLKVAEKLNSYNKLFNENKRYLTCFSAIWENRLIHARS